VIRRPPLALLAVAAVVAAIHAWLLDWLGGSVPRPPAEPFVVERSPLRPAPVASAMLVAVMTAAQAAPSVAPTIGAPHSAVVAATSQGGAPARTAELPRMIPARSARADPGALPVRAPAESPDSPARPAAAPMTATAETPSEIPGSASGADPARADAPLEAAATTGATDQQLAAADLTVAAPAPSAPAYRTRVPPSAKITYQLTRGLISGTGTLDWHVDAGGYKLRLDGAMPLLGTLITQTSQGLFDAAGLAPQRYTDRRPGRSEQAANFQRTEGRVSFSGGAPAQPLVPGLQDRLSVMLQLAAIAAAGPQPPPAGQVLTIPVVTARGEAAAWVLHFGGVQTVETPAGAIRAWRYVREPVLLRDTRAELWLDPARGYLPVRVQFTDIKGEPLELLLQSRTP
jgi:hypothetical protein